jgi:methyl-galactoside transport system substrate-binding protein
MTRIAALAAALACALAIYSCTGGGDLRPRIGLALTGAHDAGTDAIAQAVRDRARGASSLISAPPATAAQGPTVLLDSLISRGAKAVAVSLATADDVPAVIARAKDRQVPIVFFGEKPSADDLVKWDKVYFVGSRPGEAGGLQGEMAAAWWLAHSQADRNHDGRLQYVVLTAEPGREDGAQRGEASAKAMRDAGIKSDRLLEEMLPPVRTSGQEKMAAVLARLGGRIEMVFCNDDELAMGAVAALEAAGWLKPGKAMPVFGLGGEPAAVEAVRSGRLAGTVLVDRAAQGKAVHDLAAALASDRALGDLEWPITENKYLWVPCRKILP